MKIHTLFSLGNHEFDNGVNGLIPFIQNLTCPVVSANLILDDVPDLARLTNLKKSVIFNISDTQIGVIGFLTPATKTLAIKNNVEYVDEIVALQKEVDVLKNAGVKIIIALGHSGYLAEQKIAKEVRDIDLVIGGHSHTFLWNGTSTETEDVAGPYPTYVTQASGKNIPVVQAYAFTKYLGKLHLTFDANGEIITLDGKPVLLDKSIPEDPDMLAIIERYQSEVHNVSNEVIGNTSVILDTRNCHKTECNIGNLITDAMVYAYAKQYKGDHWTDAPIAALQAGGIRSSIAHSKMPATVTKGDLLTVMPFNGSLVIVTMKGSILLQVLEHSVSKYFEPIVGQFLQFSGLKVVYNVKMPVGYRVVEAVARCWACKVPKYSKVEDKQIYKVIMPDFIAAGGDGYSMMKSLPSIALPYSELLATEYYLRQHSPVFPEIEGRITILNEDVHKDSSCTATPSQTLSLISFILYLILSIN